MKRFKLFFLSMLIGVLIGLWFGLNIGKNKPVLSNPFAESPIQQQLKESGGKILEKSGEVLEKSGRALQNKTKTP